MDKNPFGGSACGMYVPLSELELEALERLRSAGDLQVVIKDWGIVHTPHMRFADKRVQFTFKICFQDPLVPIPVYYLDFEVQTQAGQLIFATRQATVVGGEPIRLGAGLAFEFILDLSLERMNPGFVKQVVPGATGLTSRHGNMHLDPQKQALLHLIKDGERRVREMDQAFLAKLPELKK